MSKKQGQISVYYKNEKRGHVALFIGLLILYNTSSWFSFEILREVFADWLFDQTILPSKRQGFSFFELVGLFITFPAYWFVQKLRGKSFLVKHDGQKALDGDGATWAVYGLSMIYIAIVLVRKHV